MILSIIIPVYNVEKFVEKCILSCEVQNIPPSEYEILCINDGSKDHSLQIVERLASEFDNITVISQPNGGLSAARNTGIRNAHGDYYMFVDSDDWIAENCLWKLTMKLKEEHPDALAICAATMYGDEAKRRQSYPDETPITGKELLKKGVAHCAPFSLWRAEFFKEHNFNFYEGIFHEDSELTPRAYYYAKKISLCNDIIYYVYQNPNSIMRSVNPKKSFDLINVVCPHLSEFSKKVEDEYKVIYYNTISTLFNNAINFIIQLDKSLQEQLNHDIIINKQLYNDLSHSSILKYRIEALLLKLVPNHPLAVYRFMQSFNNRR